MTKRDALKIIKLLVRNYEAGYADDTLADLLQTEVAKLEGSKK